SINDTIYINTFINTTPLISATPTTGNDPLPVQLTFNNSSSFTNFYWKFNDGTENSTAINPVHVYENGGTYYPTVYTTSVNGCIDSAKIEIVVEPKFEVSFPNVFTPNGDDNNDILFIKIRNGKLVYTEIYDRW
ncbi:MAG: PKD domain-containing protein, partial [Candidatus Fonsibacter sp.]